MTTKCRNLLSQSEFDTSKMPQVGVMLTFLDADKYIPEHASGNVIAAEIRSSDSAMAFEIEDCCDEIDMWDEEIF